jgi:small subunit ribosomal protein S21
MARKLSGCPHLSGADTPRRGEVSLSEVIIHDDENFERALKRFKKKCEKAGILSDLRKHRHYEKPSERRKRKMNAAVRKNRRSRHG